MHSASKDTETVSQQKKNSLGANCTSGQIPPCKITTKEN